MHRRSTDDLEWQEAKKKVDLRDGHYCRWYMILLPWEVEELKKLEPPAWMLTQIDHAHVEPVGNYLNQAYDIDNIYNLSRWAHTHIDNLINPLTNLPMEKNEQWYWWVRIRFKKTWSYDKELDYEDLYKCMAEQKEDKKKKDVMSWW